MNVKHILSEIEKIDPEVYDRLDTRRASLRSFSGIGKKIALTTLPLAMGGLFKKAYGQTGTTTVLPDVVSILNYALKLEYLESEFYATALATPTLIFPDTASKDAITTIGAHETAHVAALKQTITDLKGTPIPKPTFDFTAKGTFPTVFSDFDVFLAVSQTFEDTGVRAYKGQANNPSLMANNDVLDAALRIHSVEARHASHVRYMRRLRANNDATIKGWITGNSTAGIGTPVQASYNGEDNVTQAMVNLTTLPNAATGASITANAATEAFDEPLTYDAVIQIVSPFIVA